MPHAFNPSPPPDYTNIFQAHMVPSCLSANRACPCCMGLMWQSPEQRPMCIWQVDNSLASQGGCLSRLPAHSRDQHGVSSFRSHHQSHAGSEPLWLEAAQRRGKEKISRALSVFKITPMGLKAWKTVLGHDPSLRLGQSYLVSRPHRTPNDTPSALYTWHRLIEEAWPSKIDQGDRESLRGVNM